LPRVTTAEQAFLDELGKRLEGLEEFLQQQWSPKEWVELVLLLALGTLCGAWNPHQACQILGLPESGTYEEVGGVSVYHWRKLLRDVLYAWAIPLLLERQSKSAATHSRDGWVLSVDDMVIVRFATALGYVWKWWSGRFKQVREGQDIIVLLLVMGDRVLPLDVRIVSKQGPNVGSKPDIHQEMLDEAERRFDEAGIDIHQFKVSGDSAFLNGWAADLCAAMHVGGVFRGKGTYRFEIGGRRQTATQWKREFASRLAKGWGCEEEVYRVEAVSPTFGKVILVFYRPKEGKDRIEYLIVVGRPLRACEALRVKHAHHWIEEFWQILRSVLHVEATSLQGRAGALAGIGIKVLAYLLLEEVQHGLKKMRRFSQLTLHQLVHVCPRFVDMRAFLREHFHDRIPANYGLDQALART
jgi:hypothetical protein